MHFASYIPFQDALECFIAHGIPKNKEYFPGHNAEQLPGRVHYAQRRMLKDLVNGGTAQTQQCRCPYLI